MDNKNAYDEDLREIYKTLNTSQDKYIYFLLATTVAAIGFAITRTQNLKLSITQIPLGVGILSWGFSFWCGCLNREYFNSTLYSNSELLKVQTGQHPQVGQHPQLMKAASEGILGAINSNSEIASKLVKRQKKLFVFGSICYIIWHILEMYLRK